MSLANRRASLRQVKPDEIPAIFEPPGSCLYHYTRLGTALEYILPTWRLRMSPFTAMRDPRESRNWGFEATVSDLDALEEIEAFVELQQLARDLKDRVKVLSMTQDELTGRDEASSIFGRGFAHPRLWEHYADGHRGVCLCFDKETLTGMVAHEAARHGELHHGAVRYVDAEIAIEARRFLIEKVKEKAPQEVLREHVQEHLDELFFTKLRDWATESEYRFVLQTDHVEPVLTYVRNSLRAVIVGDEVSHSYLPSLVEFCDPLSVEVWQIRWQEARPRLQDPTALGIYRGERPLRDRLG